MKYLRDIPSYSSNDMDGVPTAIRVKFFEPVYNSLMATATNTGAGASATEVRPFVDFDDFSNTLASILSSLTEDEDKELRLMGYGDSKITKKDWSHNKSRKAMVVFLDRFPQFANLLLNYHLPASVAIRAASWHLGSDISGANFIEAKRLISKFNKVRWNREQLSDERQSGVSNLGSISEKLLAIALDSLIDEENFFQTTNSSIQSYGDFVLMCLPNNLWLSVKSNFARERLLASGYTTDILGVGYFEDYREFTSIAKNRNLQRVGFLAMYLPDVSITQDQEDNGTSTYEQVVDYYNTNGINLPVNINGTPFLRKLSELHADLSGLLSETDFRKRNTIYF